jgi:hypothetical protein
LYIHRRSPSIESEPGEPSIKFDSLARRHGWHQTQQNRKLSLDHLMPN